MIENRRHLRHVVTPRLYVAMNGASSGGILHDVSDGGLSLDVVGPKPSEEQFLLDFELPETGEHFEGVGKVVWKNDAGNRIGLQFVDLPDALRYRVRNWLSTRSTVIQTLPNMVVVDRGESADVPEPEPMPRRKVAAAGTAAPSAKATQAVSGKPESQNTSAVPPTDKALQAQAAKSKLLTTSSDFTLPSPREQSVANVLWRPEPAKYRLPGRVGKIQRKITRRLKRKVAPWMSPSGWSFSSPWLPILAVFLAMIFVAAGIRLFTSQNVSAGAGNSLVAKLLKSSPPHRISRHSTTNLVVRFEKPQLAGPSGAAEGMPMASPEAQSLPAPRSGNARGRIEEAQGQDDSTGELPFEEQIPEYPRAAVDANVQGKVVLHGIIATNGALRDVSVVSGPAMLSDAALETVKKWRYLPHYENSKLVEVESQIVVEFVIVPR